MDLGQFFEDKPHGLPEEVERRNRIHVTMAAYAYEYYDETIMSDGVFDDLCKRIQPEMDTGNAAMDKFFREEFSPHTGQWVRKHPDIAGLDRLYNKFYRRKKS